jgi:hypothetical protein
LSGLLVWGQEHLAKRFSRDSKFKEMIASIDCTIACLANSEPERRLLAIEILNTFFAHHDMSYLLPQFTEIAFHDSDTDVRSNGIAILARIVRQLSSQTQHEVGKRLAQTVLDETMANTIRKSAYQALCTLSSDFDIRLRSCDEIVFPQNVDWLYVYEWLPEGNARLP